MSGSSAVTIVEVGPRDGFQSIGPVIGTEQKIDMITRLYAAGLRRMEATAFVSQAAVPQLADAADILAASAALPGLDVQVLVPNVRHAERALAVGATHLAFVLSVSERHNRSNVRRSPIESVEEYRRIIALLPKDADVRLNVATAFDCPYLGAVDPAQTLELLEPLMEAKPTAEICLCDTTGRVTPDRVSKLFELARTRFPMASSWAFHGHDTFGLGVANVIAAWQSGVSVMDASFAGLGGCPFAPGATGNVATEDVVWTLEQMGVSTGVQIEPLLDVAHAGAGLEGAQSGGRVRTAMAARPCFT